eukprot:319929_1
MENSTSYAVDTWAILSQYFALLPSIVDNFNSPFCDCILFPMHFLLHSIDEYFELKQKITILKFACIRFNCFSMDIKLFSSYRIPQILNEFFLFLWYISN